MSLKHLFSSLRVGTLILSNRIICPPMSMSYAHEGLPTKRLAAHIGEIAKGGVGMIITESQMVHPSSVYKAMNIHAFDDRCIEGLRSMASASHRYAVPIVGHLAHMGLQMTYRASLMPLLAPSVVSRRGIRQIPKAMEQEDINDIVEAFGQAAARNKAAGLDGVEIHGAHGHLIGQFMSPLTNLRTDDYGGNMEKRVRFPLEVIGSIRNAVGRDFVVGMKISADELLEGGLTHQDMKMIATKLAATGLLDYLAISVGTYATLATSKASWYFPPGPIVHLAAGIKNVVGIPVFVGARIKDPNQADRILGDNMVDGVMLGRPLLADPEYPRKVAAGELDNIRPCIYCNFCSATGGLTQAAPVLCAVNPDLGHERTARRRQSSKIPKRVLIVGGGPAGLETAREAALRGHKVTLCERSAELGGQVALLAKDPNTAELAEITRYLIRQVTKLGIEVKLNTVVTTHLVKEMKPDEVVVATGAKPFIPDIPGARGQNVITYAETFERPESVGKTVVVLGAEYGFLTPLTIADYLADRGHQVEIVSELAVAGADLEAQVRIALYGRLSKKGVVLTQLTAVRAIDSNAVVVVDLFSKAERKIESVDTVVLAAGTRADDALYRELGGRSAGLHAVGDCIAPRGLYAAISEGSKMGRDV